MCRAGGARGLELKTAGLESQTRNPKVASSSLGPAGIVGGGVNVQRSLYPQYHDWGVLEQCTEPPTPPRAPQHKWLPTCPLLWVCVHSVCVFTAVCVHLGWDKCRAQIPSMGHHTWSYVTSLSLSFSFYRVFTQCYTCSPSHYNVLAYKQSFTTAVVAVV